jgi:hypothetical protein
MKIISMELLLAAADCDEEDMTSTDQVLAVDISSDGP